MSKAYSKAAKRRAKRNALPGLAPAPRAKKRGRARMDEIPQEREDVAQATVLKARCRKMGKPEANHRDMASVMLTEAAGMALSMICDPTQSKRLWSHYTALTAAEARYHRSLGRSIHPKTAKIEMMQERFETRADDVIDIRSEEERDRSAVNIWMRWQGYLGRIDAEHRDAIYQAYRYNADLVDAGTMLKAGKRFVVAMIALDEAMG